MGHVVAFVAIIGAVDRVRPARHFGRLRRPLLVLPPRCQRRLNCAHGRGIVLALGITTIFPSRQGSNDHYSSRVVDRSPGTVEIGKRSCRTSLVPRLRPRRRRRTRTAPPSASFRRSWPGESSLWTALRPTGARWSSVSSRVSRTRSKRRVAGHGHFLDCWHV